MQEAKLKNKNKKNIADLKVQLNLEKKTLNKLIDDFEEKSSQLKSCLKANIENNKFFILKESIFALNEEIIEKKKAIISIEDRIKISCL